MRDPNRIPEILKTLEDVWKQNPDYRLGQIIVNASNLTGRQIISPEIFYLEDEEILKGLREFLARRRT